MHNVFALASSTIPYTYLPSTSLLAQHLFFDTSRVPSGSVSKKTKERYYGGGGGRGVEMRMRDGEGLGQDREVLGT